MRFKVIACEVLAREIYLCAAGSLHLVDLELVEKGLHNTPDKLRVELQERIDATQPGRYDAVLLGYGLCGNALLGLTAHDVPVVVPRAHDCITLYLGSRSKYNAKFAENSGTYYYTADYIERTSSDKDSLAVSLGTALTTDIQAVYATYVEKYGQDNADYLMEVMGEWSSHYSRAVYIDHEDTRFLGLEKLAIDEANRRGWKYENVPGSVLLFRQLMSGEWPAEDFLVVEPGHKIEPSYDDKVICAT
jgi:hypothetical protein